MRGHSVRGFVRFISVFAALWLIASISPALPGTPFGAEEAAAQTTPSMAMPPPRYQYANGAELRFRLSGDLTGFQKIEIHRSATAGFTPGPATLLSSTTDPEAEMYRDTSAKPGQTFYYRARAVFSGSTVGSAERAVTLPAAGEAKVVIQSDALHGGTSTYITNGSSTPCVNHGAAQAIKIGTTATETYRGLIHFDLRGIPARSQVLTASVQTLFPATSVDVGTVNLHRVTRAWLEGKGDATCAGDGATWQETQGGVPWGTAGGNFAPTAIASVTKPNRTTEGWDSFSVQGLVQDWLNAKYANLGVLLKLSNETLTAGKNFTYRSDDFTTTIHHRPKLIVTFKDPSTAVAPIVAVATPTGGDHISGTTTVTAATADDSRVDQVAFFHEGSQIGTDSTAPFAVQWQTPGSGWADDQTLTATATDDVGQEATSDGVDVVVDNSQTPTTAVTAPAANATVGGGPSLADDFESGTLSAWTSSTGSTVQNTGANTGTYAMRATANASAAYAQKTLPSTTKTMTFQTWFKFLSQGSNPATLVAVNKAGGTNIFTVSRSASGKLQMWNEVTNQNTTSGQDINLNQWYGLELRISINDTSSTLETYLDGTQITALSGTMSLGTDPIGHLRIGDANGTRTFDVMFDDVDAVTPPPPVTVEADATAASGQSYDGVSRVEFLVDGEVVGEDAAAPFKTTWEPLTGTAPAFDGTHELTTAAFDQGGQKKTSTTVPVTVSNAGGSIYRAEITLDQADGVPQAVPGAPSGGGGDTQPVKVKVKNTSNANWPASSKELWFRWRNSLGAVVHSGLGGTLPALASGATTATPIQVNVTAPVLPDGASRDEYVLEFDVRNKPNGRFFADMGNPPLRNAVVVGHQLAKELGLERWFHYVGEDVGAGMTQHLNVANGNSLLHWRPFSSPGRGLATVLDLTYNSLEEHSDSPVGNNFSLSISSLLRLGLPLDVHPNKADEIGGRSNRWIEFTDGDGTTHRFTDTDANNVYEEPPGVNLYLRLYSTTDPLRKWAITRPDRVTYFFGDDGFPTFVTDRNGNSIQFEYEAVPSGEDPGGPKKRVVAVKDAANRQFTIDYFSKAEAQKPQIRGKVQRITDHEGHALDFTYYEDGNLLRLIQRGGQDAGGGVLADRSFVFTYTHSSGSGAADPPNLTNPDPKTPNQSTKLYGVADPRGTRTTFAYITSGQNKWKLASRTNRTGDQTSFSYDIQNRVTTVNEPLSTTSTFAYDTTGRVTTITNPKNETTGLEWSTDNQVTKVTEHNTKFTAYTYNPNGYMLTVTDQLGNTTELTYQNLAVDGNSTLDPQGHISQLIERTNPMGVNTTTDPDDHDWQFTYDSSGNLKTVTDAMGFVTTLNYETDGDLSEVIETIKNSPLEQRKTCFQEYDPNGFPQTVVEACGATEARTTRFGYDADGLLLWVQDPLHAGDTGSNDREYKTYFYYDDFHRLQRQSTPRSTRFDRGQLIWTGVQYDANDNVVAQINPHYGVDFTGQAPVTSFAYDNMDRQTRVTEPARLPDDGQSPLTTDEKPRITDFTYDALGRMTRTVLPAGTETTSQSYDSRIDLAYDPLGRVIEQTRYVDQGGTPTALDTRFCYDNVGNLIREIAPRAASAENCNTATGSLQFTTRYEWDFAHKLRKVFDPENRMTEYTYDANSNVFKVIDPEGNFTSHSYDQLDQVLRIQMPFEPSTQTTPTPRTVSQRYVYDGLGRIIKDVTPRGFDEDNGARQWDSFLTEFTYDKLDQVTKVALPFDANVQNPATHYIHNEYDANGNVTLTTLPSTNGTLANVAEDLKTRISYFDTGWVRTQDENLEPTDPSPKVRFDYTAEGWQQLRVPHASGAGGGWNWDDAMRWGYYPDGLLRERRDKEDGLTTYAYDPNGNLTEAIDAGGVATENRNSLTVLGEYDWADRPTRIRTREEGETNYRATTYAYNDDGNVTNRVDDIIQNASGGTVQNGRTNEYTYDRSGWIDIQVDKGTTPSDCTDDRRIENDFFLTGWEQERRIFGGTSGCGWTSNPRQTTRWTWWANGDLKTLETRGNPNAGNTLYESHTISYDDLNGFYNNGHRTRDEYVQERAAGSSPCPPPTGTCVATWRYDPRDRLTRYDDGQGDSGDGITTYQLDPAGNITQEVVDGTTQNMEYSGNRLTTVKNGSGVVQQRYFYDGTGNLDCVTNANGTAATCPYSDQGTTPANLIREYSYDGLDRLVGFRDPLGGKDATYVYDALDRLLSETEDHSGSVRTTDFSYQGLTGLISSEDASGTHADRTYTYDAWGHRVGMTRTAGGQTSQFTYAYDPHGSTSLLLKDSGGVEASYGYSPYGEPDGDMTSEPNGTSQEPLNPFRYSGRRLDSASGTIDMGARRFGPSPHQFIQKDVLFSSLGDLSLGFDPLTQNRYSLAGGNPVSYTEWDGHMVAADGNGNGAKNPAPVVSSDSSSDRADYDGSRPSVVGFSFPKRPGHGTIAVEIFIAAPETGLFTQELRGDDRGFNLHIDRARTRAYIEFNFERGRGFVRVNPSCTPDGECRNPQLPTADPGDYLESDGGKNLVQVLAGEERVGVSLELRQSRRHPVPYNPPISATFIFKPREQPGQFDRFISADAYPSYEVTHHGVGGSRYLYRRREDHWTALFGDRDFFVCDMCPR